MKVSKLFRRLLCAVAVPLALVYWPVGCAGSGAIPASSAPVEESGAAGLRGPISPEVRVSSSEGRLPHPAFAFAGTEAGAASIADIAERTMPSVVSIKSERQVEGGGHPFFPFFGPQEPRRRQGMGSGVLVSGDGIVLTNHHVVEEATDIRVTSSDDREFDAEVVGSDAKSDLAVLRLKGDLSGLNPLTLGNSAQLRLGDIVLAIGNPFGVGQTVTMGIVSAKGRADVGIVDYEDFIQTDAAINPGNSGGALVNMRGELVGINTAILSRSGGYQGIGFAIPSNMAHPIMKSLVEHGRVARGFLGIGIQDIDNELMKAMKLPDGRGVLVTQVQKDSAAAKAGLERGDVVLAVDGSPVDSTGNLRNLIAAKGADAKVLLTVLRRGKTLSLDVELSELPSDEPVTSSPTVEGGSALGMKLAPLDPQARQRFRLPKDAPGKVVIVEVKRGSRAAEAGLRPGDVILEVDRNVISGLSGAEKALSNAKDAVLVVISRGGGNRYIVVQPASTK